VLESLRVIGEDAERREHYDEIEEKFVTGEYPSLEKFDQDLGVLIQELFDQQRAILRRDLRDSQAQIAARVADEIKSPDAVASRRWESWLERSRPAFSYSVTAVITILAIAFAWFYWRAEQSGQDLLQENIRLQRTLDEQQSVGTKDTLQIRRQLGEYEQALDSTRAVALSSLEWATNQSAQYDFDELPLGDARLSIVADLTSHLAALDYRGLVRIESHVGDYCMSESAIDGFSLAAPDLPAAQCQKIGFDSSEAYELGLRQSVAFANFINQAGQRDSGKIRYEVVSRGNMNPLLDYPATATGIPASVWNQIAAGNNRVDITLYPDRQ